MAAKKKSPWKAAFAAFGITVLIGMVLAVAVYIARGMPGDPYASGERLGNGLGIFAAIVGVIAYFVTDSRNRRGR